MNAVNPNSFVIVIPYLSPHPEYRNITKSNHLISFSACFLVYDEDSSEEKVYFQSLN
jgi:hypothetical protein